jgi:hypothetical protein
MDKWINVNFLVCNTIIYLINIYILVANKSPIIGSHRCVQENYPFFGSIMNLYCAQSIFLQHHLALIEHKQMLWNFRGMVKYTKKTINANSFSFLSYILHMKAITWYQNGWKCDNKPLVSFVICIRNYFKKLG